MIFSFCIILFFGMASYVAKKSPDFSEEENRTLATLPRLSDRSWREGKFSRRMESYFADRVAMRPTLVRAAGVSGSSLLCGLSRGVCRGSNGQLAACRFDAYISPTERISDTDFFSESHIRDQCAATIRIADSLADGGMPLCFLPAPRTIDVYAPSSIYPQEPSDELDGIINSCLSNNENLKLINLLPSLREAYADGAYVIFRTDHHWTTEGAYMAYLEIMKNLAPNEKPLGREDFSVRKIQNFIGTTASRACVSGTPLCRADVLEIWEREDDKLFTVTDNAGFEMRGFIDEKFLSTKDKYGAYLSGTRNFLEIYKTDENGEKIEGRPRLLVAKDSFANNVIPLLARHFDVIVLNLSGGMTDVSLCAKKYNVSAVLVLYNRENMVSADYLNRVR